MITVPAKISIYHPLQSVNELRDGWAFRVGTWNVESLTGRSGELVEALGERRIDIACVQEIRWRGNSCRYFGATGKGISCFGWELQPFNSLFSRTTWVSRYRIGKTNLDFTGARDSEWQWHQLGHMQVCTSLQTDNHRPDALPVAQPTASKH